MTCGTSVFDDCTLSQDEDIIKLPQPKNENFKMLEKYFTRQKYQRTFENQQTIHSNGFQMPIKNLKLDAYLNKVEQYADARSKIHTTPGRSRASKMGNKITGEPMSP